MISEEQKRVLELFKEGRRLYTMQKFQEAREVFERAIAIDREDGPSRIYHQRCKQYLEDPPGDDWDGVFVMKTK
jgi:hypothetical protein